MKGITNEYTSNLEPPQPLDGWRLIMHKVEALPAKDRELFKGLLTIMYIQNDGDTFQILRVKKS